MEVGLCETCTYARKINNKRGSLFFMCEYSEKDPEFDKYPRLPVLTCKAYQKINANKNTAHRRKQT